MPSQMANRVSVRRVVGILFATVHEFVLEDLVDHEVEDGSDDDSLPQGFRNLVVELCVEPVNLLDLVECTISDRRIRQHPHAQVVHVDERVPTVLEVRLHAWGKEVVGIWRLPDVL